MDIFKKSSIHQSYDDIRNINNNVQQKKEAILDKIDSIRFKYKNHSSIRDYFKVPRIFPNKGQRSFATLMYNGYPSTIQEGFFGQLDQEYYNFCLEVFNSCVSRIDVCRDDFSKIFSFMGAVPMPITIPAPSTGIIRENQGLPRDPNDNVLTDLKNFMRDFFSYNYKKDPAFVYKISSTGNPGFPHMINLKGSIIDKNVSPYPDEAFKIFKKNQVLMQNEFYGSKAFLDALDSNDLEKLYYDYDILYFYTDQHRGQPDRSNKIRFGYTADNWNIYNSNRDHEFELDKEIIMEKFFGNFRHLFNQYGDFRIKSRKWRFVFAESSSSNTVPNLILSRVRYNYGKNFEFTFKCGDHITITEKLRNYINDNNIRLEDKDVVVFDISQFDNSISPRMLESYILGISEVNFRLANELAKLSLCPGGCSLPYVNLDVKSRRNQVFLLGDPFDVKTFCFGTSPSGTADVSEKAKLMCSFFVLRSIFQYDFEKYCKIMKGQDESFTFLNLGDNNCIIADKKLKVKEKLQASDMFKIDISEELIFGGSRFIINYALNEIKAIPNAGSFLMKMLAPERPLDDTMRHDYLLGLEYRYELSQTNPEIAFVMETIDRKLMDMFGCSEQQKLARQRKKDLANKKSYLYEQMSRFISEYGILNLSRFFKAVVESDGDKLFYTDLYDKLTDDEKKIIDSAFFSVFDENEIGNIIDAYE